MDEISVFYNDVLTSYSNNLGYINKCIIGILVGYATLRVSVDVAKYGLGKIFKFERSLGRNNPTDPKYDPNKIYLHMFYRRMTKQVPNLSPFAIKLETWMRLINLDYEVVETTTFSNETRQIPYINHKGNEVADSEFIIEYLEKEFDLDAFEGLDKELFGISRAFIKLVDESMSGTYFLHRYVYDNQGFRRVYGTPFQNKYVASLFRYVFKKLFLSSQISKGIGRKKPGQVYHVGENDIKAISLFLADKLFLLGDKMTKVDCAMFGNFCQIMYVDFHYPHMDIIKSECTNLIPYMERIKQKCWPDWDQIVDKETFF